MRALCKKFDSLLRNLLENPTPEHIEAVWEKFSSSELRKIYIHTKKKKCAACEKRLHARFRGKFRDQTHEMMARMAFPAVFINVADENDIEIFFQGDKQKP